MSSIETHYDFIVVGSGAGGGHATARLVNAGFTVLCLEAGGDFWEQQNVANEEKAYCVQIGANDEMFWDWDYRCEAGTTGYEGTWAGLLVVVATGAVGATYTLNGVALTPAGGPRTPGSNDYDDTLPTVEEIAEDIWDALRDGLNGFLAAGIKARCARNFLIIDRVVPVVGATVLSSSDPAKGTLAATTAEITAAQATIREVDQSMGRMVGGSGNHFGYLCYRASLEDYDEWDYCLTKNCSVDPDGIGGLRGTVDFSGFPAVVGVGTEFTTQLKVGDYIQDAASPYPVGGTVPHRVATIVDDLNLTLDPDPTGKAAPASGAGAKAIKNTIWNRSRMLQTYIAIENDLQYGPAGRTPDATLHGSNAFPATTLGYVGNDGLGDTGAWNTAPPGTSRVPVALDAAVTGLTTSAAAMPAGRFPPLAAVPTFHLTIDRNGQNNWGDPTAWGDTEITGVDPFSAHKIPMNEIGTDTLAQLVDGGRQTGGLFHLNKYSERISQLVSAIDPIRSAANFTLLANALVDKILLADYDGDGLKAYGVSYYHREEEGGEWHREEARGTNIVIAAGPIGSPAIFHRSGIGAIDRLAPFGIPQLVNLPGVGADVVTHMGVGAGSGFSFTLPAENNIVLSGVYYAGLYKSSYTQSPSRRAFAVGGHTDPDSPPMAAVLFDQGPDMRFNFGAGVGNEASPISNNNYGLPTKQGTRNYGRTVTAGCNMFKCRSRGDGVRLRSASPFDPPEYRDGRFQNPNSFELEAMVELATVLSIRLADNVPGSLPAVFPTGTVSAASQTQPSNINNWIGPTGRVATLHSTVSSALHAVSTIKMGPPSETTTGWRSCLDQYGRVYGVKNLAVCDNCIHPTTTRGNPWLPTVACAENLTQEWIAQGGLDF